MKKKMKRAVCLLLALCVVLGLLPAPALAAGANIPVPAFSVELRTDLARYRQLPYEYDWLWRPDQYGEKGFGAYNVAAVRQANGSWVISANEKAKYRYAEYMVLPFDIAMTVPAGTTYTVDFQAGLRAYTGSERTPMGCQLELFSGEYGLDDERYKYEIGMFTNSTTKNSVIRASSNKGKPDNRTGSFTAVFSNPGGSEAVIKHKMTYLVISNEADSSDITRHHQSESSVTLTATSCVQTASGDAGPSAAAAVDGFVYAELADAVKVFRRYAIWAPTLTLLRNDLEENICVSGGIVDLNGRTFKGMISCMGGRGGELTIKNGTVSTNRLYAVKHEGRGTLKLEKVKLIRYSEDIHKSYTPSLCTDAGTLILGEDVTVEPGMLLGAKTVFEAAPTIIASKGPDPSCPEFENYGIRLYEGWDEIGYITLGNGVNLEGKEYLIRLEDRATEEDHELVLTNWNQADDPDDHFLTRENSDIYYFYKDDTGQVWARPAKVNFHPGKPEEGVTGVTITPNSVDLRRKNKYNETDNTYTGAANLSGWPADPVREGYKFLGWKTEDGKTATREGIVDGETVTRYKRQTDLYADWQPLTVDVTFEPNGGTLASGTPAAKTFRIGENYELPAAPTREYYIFDGWYTAQTGGDKVENGAKIERTTDHTLYAHWTRDKVTVTFNYNYTGAADTTRSINKGGPIGTLPKPARTGYTFDGWYDAPTGGNEIDANKPVTVNTACYAHWTANQYTVTYNANGGKWTDGDTKTATYDYEQSSFAFPTEPTRTGYTFNGWYTAPTDGTQVTADTTVTTAADHTLYAHWTANQYTVNFDANGGTVSISSMTATYGQPYGEGTGLTDHKLPVPTLAGHTFQGWYTAPSGGDMVTASTVMNKDLDHTLHAQWAKNHDHMTHPGAAGTTDFGATGLTQDDFTNFTNGVSADGNFYMLAGGDYFLAENITVNTRIEIEKDTEVTLCLNGHTITTGKTNAFFDVDGTLNICDCQGTGGISSEGTKSVQAGGSSTVNLYGGTLSALGDPFDGAVSTSGTFTLDGATVKATADGATALKVGSYTAGIKSGTVEGPIGVRVVGGTLDVTGGTIISPPTGKYGMIMNGSNITANIEGGRVEGPVGIYLASGTSTVNVSGGAINGSEYGIQYNHQSEATCNLSGSPVIQGGTAGIYLYKKNTSLKQTITVQSGLTGAFSVGCEKAVSAASPVDITTAAGEDYSAHFTAAKEGCGVRNSGSGDSQVVQLYVPHEHKVCGVDGTAACAHSGDAHSGAVDWTPLTADTVLEDGGHYYLTKDLTRNISSNISLCLNGFKLTGWYNNSGTLNLCDCKGSGSVDNSSSTNNVAISIQNNATLNQYGGTLTASSQPVDLKSGGTWNFYKGALKGTSDTPHAIPLNGTLNLLGGGTDINMDTVSIQVKDGCEPIHVIGAAPAESNRYKITLPTGGTTYPCPVADGLPEDADPETYFTENYAHLKFDNDGGEVVLRGYLVTVKGGEVLMADHDGKLTAGQLTKAQPELPVGQKWVGWFDASENGTQVTADTTYDGDSTIYPRWTKCDHSGNTNEGTTVSAACTAAGSKSYTCSVCGAAVTEVIPATGHTVDSTWKSDESEDVHYKECTVCKERIDEARHTWGEGSSAEDGNHKVTVTYTCSVCKDTKTEEIQKYTVTYLPGAYAGGTAPAQEVREEGETVSLPTADTASFTRAGYTLAGWVEQGGGILLTDELIMPAQNVILEAVWTPVPDYVPEPGKPVVTPDGTTITKNDDGTVTVTTPDKTDDQGNPIPGTGTTTTVTPPPGGEPPITITGGGGVNVPPGSTVTTPDPDNPGGPPKTTTVTEAGVLDPDTGEVPPRGGDNEVKIGETVIVLPEGADKDPDKGGVPQDENGNSEIPGGSTVKIPDGEGGTKEVTVPEGGKITDDGGITVPPGESIVIKNDDGTTTEITPAPGQPVTPKPDGTVEIPGGTTVTNKDKDGKPTGTTKVPEGDEPGAVTPGGGVTVPDKPVDPEKPVDPVDPDKPAFTVTFDSAGGSAVPPQTVAKGGTVTEPIAPARPQHVFGGWFADAACTQRYDFAAPVTASLTLYAKWTLIFNITGSVTDENNNAVSGAEVKLMRGVEQIGSCTTTADGKFSFTGVPAGSYNLVAETTDGRTVTSLAPVTDSDITQPLKLPAGKVNSVLEVKPNDDAGSAAAKVEETVVGGLDTEAQAVHDESPAAVSVTVTMTVKRRWDYEVDPDTELIKAAALPQNPGGEKKLELLAITVEKKVETTDGGNTTATETELLETKTLLTIVIPFDFTGKTNVEVYRSHGGQADALTGTPNAAGEYAVMDAAAGLITVHAKKFSTYAVGYENLYKITVETDGNGAASSSAGSAVKGTGITLTASPNAGYQFKEWQVVSGGVTLSGNSFTMPAGDVTVKAVFQKQSTPTTPTDPTNPTNPTTPVTPPIPRTRAIRTIPRTPIIPPPRLRPRRPPGPMRPPSTSPPTPPSVSPAPTPSRGTRSP